ncbi:MAG: prohibitin family protein [Candidatus Omnitrophica bacterium]|nr:prohibitin family protein [Candidatus Omnitrophota bacterium]
MKNLMYLAVVLFSAFALMGCAVVGIEDGQAGVKIDLGKIQDNAVSTGWHFFIPGVSSIEVWNVKLLEIKETAQVPSSEGLISQLDLSILYQIPKENVTRVRKTIGADYQTTVLEPYIREAIRNVASGYEVKALYSDEGRNKIGKQMLEFLKAKLDSKGIIVIDVLLRDVKLPAAFMDSIQQKLKTEQEALQKQFELQKAEKDAQIAVAKAKGVAESNKIIAGSISDNYLRYLWIEGLQSNEKQIIYVPTEANLPIMEAGRSGLEKQPK